MAEKVAKAKKQPLKERDPEKYFSRVRGWCKAGTIASLAAPIVAVFGAKWNEYIQVTYSDGAQGAVKLSVGAICSLIVAAIITYKYVRHNEKAKHEVSMASWVVGLGLAFAICWAFQAILNDLTLILGCEFAGSVAAYGFDLGAQHANNRLKPYEDEKMRAQARADYKKAHAPKDEEEDIPIE